jgi:hypothetical protein
MYLFLVQYSFISGAPLHLMNQLAMRRRRGVSSVTCTLSPLLQVLVVQENMQDLYSCNTNKTLKG